MDYQGLSIMGVDMSMRLDISERYRYFDKNEILWVYSYQHIGDVEGWFAWVTKPGEKEICIGRVPESEVVNRIESNRPLTQDDLIDLELWIKSGGLDIQPKENE
jgi:hypothetical protein